MALGGETGYMRKQMQDDPGGYGRAVLVVLIIGITLLVAFFITGGDNSESSKQTETTTTSVLDSGNVVDQGDPSADEIGKYVEKENQIRYEEYMQQQADEYMQNQLEEGDGFEGQPY